MSEPVVKNNTIEQIKEECKAEKQIVKYGYQNRLSALKYVYNNSYNTRGQKYIYWGEQNDLPYHLYALYLNNTKINTVCNTVIDYVFGGGIELSESLSRYIKNEMAQDYKENNPFLDELSLNKYGETLEDIVKQSIEDYVILGTFSDDLIYNIHTGKLVEMQYLDVANVRLNKNIDKCTIGKNWLWGNGNNSNSDNVDIWLFNPARLNHYNKDGKIIKVGREIFFDYNPNARTIYPLPRHFSALDDIETDAMITLFNKNMIKNGFSTKGILHIPGEPSEEELQMTYDELKARYCGPQGSGELIISKGNIKVEYTPIPDDNFTEKYKTITREAERNIYATWRISPNITGIPIDGIGFNSQEYLEAAQLFYNAMVFNIRNYLINKYDKIFCIKDCFKFKASPLEMILFKDDITKNENTIDDNLIENVLDDLSVNERRELIGFEPIDESDADTTILADRLGVGGTQALIEIIKDTEIGSDEKRGALSVVFGLDEEQIKKIIK